MSGKNHDHVSVTQSLFIRFLVDPRVPLSLAEFRIVQNVALIFFLIIRVMVVTGLYRWSVYEFYHLLFCSAVFYFTSIVER